MNGEAERAIEPEQPLAGALAILETSPPRRVAVVVFPVVDDQGVPGGDRQRRLPLAPIGSQVA